MNPVRKGKNFLTARSLTRSSRQGRKGRFFLRRVNAGEKSCILSEERRFKNANVFYPIRDGKFELCGMLLVNHATSVIDQELPRKAELFTWRPSRLERVRERAVQFASVLKFDSG
ncbi:MAG: hypothetical protein K9J81_08815 [Desulfohalobiaceae bacterium]|nr:hypothetical protein [Desulfohalobiaceae bacterium]